MENQTPFTNFSAEPHSNQLIEQVQVPLAPMTSWRIGGCAERFIRPNSANQLAQYLRTLPQGTPLTWLGLGSNVLIRDQGVKGVVISSKSLNQFSLLEDERIYADAGLTCAKFARLCCQNGFPQGAFFAGIPGTIGGALAMNAGAFGGETWEWVQSASVITPSGIMLERMPTDYEISYRTVHLKQLPKNSDHVLNHEAFLGAYFSFPKDTLTDGMGKIKDLLRKRNANQPIGTYNCGSVYRNPDGTFAAKLIESSGLKGYQIGDISVSDKHANFILNHGKGTSQDVEKIMHEVEQQVYHKYQVMLQREVRIIGEIKD